MDFMQSWLRHKEPEMETPCVSTQTDGDNLEEICTELLETFKWNKAVIDRLANDGITMKRKVHELEMEAANAKKEMVFLNDELGKQDKLILSELSKMKENKKELGTVNCEEIRRMHSNKVQ